MKLSTKGRYGLRAMIDLASHEEEGAVSIASISERQNISESYLEQLVRPLRKAGFIESSDSTRTYASRAVSCLFPPVP